MLSVVCERVSGCWKNCRCLPTEPKSCSHSLQVRPLVDEIVGSSLFPSPATETLFPKQNCHTFKNHIVSCTLHVRSALKTIHPYVVSEAATADARARWLQVLVACDV